jgi:hypothetical protein
MRGQCSRGGERKDPPLGTQKKCVYEKAEAESVSPTNIGSLSESGPNKGMQATGNKLRSCLAPLAARA